MPRKHLSLLLILILIIQISVGLVAFPATSHATGNIYYVDNTCSNNGNGTAQTCASSPGGQGPFNSIANAQSAVTGNQSGNSLLLKAGDTFREQYTVPAYGTSAGQFTIGSYGSGSLPQINGADLIGSWSSYTGLVTGSFSMANARLSLINGTAFVDWGVASSLSPYLGSQITIKDGGNHAIVGYIKAAGGGETYGTELLPVPTMDTLSPPYGIYDATLATLTTGCQAGHCMQLTNTGSGYGTAEQPFSLSSGMLALASAYALLGTAPYDAVNIEDTTFYNYYGDQSWHTPGSWTNIPAYFTGVAGATGYEQNYSTPNATAGQTAIFDTASVKQVLTPSTTGATITSSAGGSTYNWNSIDGSFIYNDSRGYTYSINTAPPNIWSATVTTQPQQVFFNGTKGTAVGSISAVTAVNYWYWASNVLYVYSTSNPATAFTSPGIEASSRDDGIYADNDPYLTVQGIEVKYCNQLYGSAGITLMDNTSGSVINGVIADYNWGQGIGIGDWTGANVVSNVTIENSQSYYNGEAGIAVSPETSLAGTSTMSNVSVVNNVVHHNSQDGTAAYTAGIHIDTPGLFTNYAILSCLVQGNQEYLNGINSSGTIVSNAFSGSGIWLDTTENCTVRYNNSYQNAGTGIFVENGESNSVYYNLTSGNNNTSVSDSSGISIGTSRSDLISQSNTVYNNTSYDDGYCISTWGDGAAPGTNTVQNNLFKNNICSSSTLGVLEAFQGAENVQETYGLGSGNVYTYNDFGPAAVNFIEWGENTGGGLIYYGTYATWETATGNCGTAGCSHSVESDPLFVSTSTDNFALQSSSPAIDAGLNLGTTYEWGLDPASTWPSNIILDNQNNYGSGWEMGAYVYTQTSTPSVVMTAPANLATVSSTVTVSASSTAVSPASIASVQFYLDGSPLGSPVTSTSSPNTYSYSWNTVSTTNASHSLLAVALDNYGNTATSSAVSLTVSNGSGSASVIYTLNLTASGTGQGSIAGAGLKCTASCSLGVVSGQSVSLTAIPAAGSVFAGWNGDCSSAGTNPVCSISLTANKTAIASFNLASSSSGSSSSGGGGTIILPAPSPTSTPPGLNYSPASLPAPFRLVNDNGTFYLIQNNIRQGITSPGLLNSFGLTFNNALPATAADLALPQGSLLLPNDGALVKIRQDPTVFLVSGQIRHGFASAAVFLAAGFKWASVFTVTAPELSQQPIGTVIADPQAQHLPCLDINRNGTVFHIGLDNQLHGYPDLNTYNSWHLAGDFSAVVPANAKDLGLPLGSLMSARVFH